MLHNLNRFEEALSDGGRAQVLDPANSDIRNNTGAALQKCGRHQEALQWFDRAPALRPNSTGALDNRSPRCGPSAAAMDHSPSPRLRGEGWGEEVDLADSPLTRSLRLRPLPARGER